MSNAMNNLLKEVPSRESQKKAADLVKMHTRSSLVSILFNVDEVRNKEALREQNANQAITLIAQRVGEIMRKLSVNRTISAQTLEIMKKLEHADDTQTFDLAICEIALANTMLNERLDKAVEIDFKAFLPSKAPQLYKDWKKENRGKNALDCLYELYGTYLAQGVLYQDDLSGKDGLDPALMKAINSYCSANKLSNSTFIPPKKEKIDAILSKVPKEKINKINALYVNSKKR
ncbi:hypothetical protein BOO24_18200 [Vibrio navarrensis]|uniref:hypothetical protein n=1 Tax=Vibrio navarrensis TaxID=29495 RepID=UPI001869A7CA|nr:hypothetical protein [Vibrio navarrensis]MBE4594272.1 hypothetical protein [Vibrio navarrensis]